MKKILLAIFLFCGAWMLIETVTAAPRLGVEVTKTYLNEGNTRVPFAVACSSTAWTEVLPAGITRRSAILHTLSTADGIVCLSTATTSALTCAAATNGIHLEKGGAVVDNSEAVLYGRVETGATGVTAYSVYVYGIVYNDSKDAGDLTN
jgi:hypothetical protein